VRGNPRLYGGLIVHAGVVIFAIALGVSSGYATRREVSLDVGQSARVSGYTFTYLGRTVDASAQKTTISARVRIQQGTHSLGVYEPAISSFPNSEGGIGTPSVRTGILRDIYLTLVSSPTSGRVTLGVAVNPLVVWLWFGGLVMASGVAIALVPTKRRKVRVRQPRDPVTRVADDEPSAEDDLTPVGAG
jgi:cytochrome c-type biogenesis protein CcmF